jgi:hypothetical protein
MVKQVNASAIVTETNGYAAIDQTPGIGVCQWNYSGGAQLYLTNIAWSDCAENTCNAFCQANFQFYDNATDYVVTMIAYNTSASLASNNSIITYTELVAISLGSPVLNFGAFAPSKGHGKSNQTEVITNLGNVLIDIQVNGTNMNHSSLSALIPVGKINYDITSDAMASETPLTLTPTLVGTFNLLQGASSTKNTWWDIHVPSGTDQWIPAGTYTGRITIIGVTDS